MRVPWDMISPSKTPLNSKVPSKARVPLISTWSVIMAERGEDESILETFSFWVSG